jgi:hypothetical protein
MTLVKQFLMKMSDTRTKFAYGMLYCYIYVFFSAFDGIHDVLLDLGIWMTDLQMLSIDQSDSATLSFSFWPIFQQQLRSVVMSLHGDHLEWCPIPFSPDVYARGHATAAQP